MPIFLSVLATGIIGAIMSIKYSELLEEKHAALEGWFTRQGVKLQRRYPAAWPYVEKINNNSIGRFFICCYFINEALTVVQTNPRLAFLVMRIFGSDGVWQEHRLWVDLSNLAGGIAAGFCLVWFKPMIMALVMLADILVDAYVILARILMGLLYGHGLYINELMAKKFSLMGCVGMLIAFIVQSRQRKGSFPGLLMEQTSTSTPLSVALLLARLAIAFLFLYVGLSELHRLLFQPYTPYLPGDGHDVVWPKAVELILALPFTLGFQTITVTRLLAASLVLEAFYAWTWWHMSGDVGAFAQHRRAIHYREHFMTNIATAGGLLLLQRLGGGKYTVDELLKKKD